MNFTCRDWRLVTVKRFAGLAFVLVALVGLSFGASSGSVGVAEAQQSAGPLDNNVQPNIVGSGTGRKATTVKRLVRRKPAVRRFPATSTTKVGSTPVSNTIASVSRSTPRATVAAGAAVARTTPGPMGGESFGDLRLSFDENFDGSSLDTRRWNTCFWWSRNGCTIHGGDEEQWYLGSNVSVSNGTLQLVSRREPTLGAERDGAGKSFPFSSGMVASDGKFSFVWGVVEFRAKLPKGNGLWPALWLLDEARTLDEIDVVEYYGRRSDRPEFAYHVVTPEGPKHYSYQAGTGDISEDWHVFAVRRTPTAIEWYVDGVLRRTHREWVSGRRMYLIANLAIGGPYGGSSDATTPNFGVLAIDYIRVWEPGS